MNLYEKLIEIRKSVPSLHKGESGPQFKYVSSSQALGALRGEMDEQKVLLKPEVLSSSTQFINRGADKVDAIFTELIMKFTWINAEAPEEVLESEWYGQGIDFGTERGVGKALTYAEKYFLLKFFNIATDKDDPDADQGNGKKYQQNGKQSRSEGKTEDACTEPQRKKIYAMCNNIGIPDNEAKQWMESRYKVTSSKDLTKKQASDFIEFLGEIEKQQQPPEDEEPPF